MRCSLEICPQTRPGAAVIARCVLLTASSYSSFLACGGALYQKMRFIFVIKRSIFQGSVYRHPKREVPLAVLRCSKGHLAFPRPLLLLRIHSAWKRSCFIKFWTFVLTARTWSGPPSVDHENITPLPRSEIMGFQLPGFSLCTSSILLQILRVWRRSRPLGYGGGMSERYCWLEIREETMSLIISTIGAAKKDTPFNFSNAAL